MLGARDLRAFCRPPNGVAVAFAGVSTYPDDGTPVCGLFDRTVTDDLSFGGGAGVTASHPELRLPYNAFAPMPGDNDSITVIDDGVSTPYLTGAPTAEDDGAFLAYQLRALPGGITVQASAATGQSIASDVLDAVVAILGGNAAGAWRCRFRPFAVTELPADNVLIDQNSLDYQASDDVDRTFRFFVRHTVAAADAADKLADARYVRGARLILADPTLGGLVRYTREISAKPDMDQAEVELFALAVTYEVEFSTSRSDPSVAGL